MFSRVDYLKANTGADRAEQTALHRRYYAEIIEAMGGWKYVSLPFSEADVAGALEAGDTSLNTLPLRRWDNYVSRLTRAAPALRERGDGLTLGTGVCILKEAARLRHQARLP